MLKKIIISLSLATCSLLVLADQLKINGDAPKTYIVEKGDTLWDISSVFLQQPWLWPKLWRINPEINNPHLIYPGDVLKLVLDAQGEPMLVVDKPVVEDVPAEKSATTVKSKPNYKWSPGIRKQMKDDSAISLLPLEVIAPYLQYDHLFTEEELENLPHIIGSDEGFRMTVDGFKVYVNSDLDLAKTYAIYSKGEELFDPETEESIGFYMVLTGTAQTLRTGDMSNKEPATLKVTSVKREIHAGNYVVPVHEGQLLPSVFTMRAADASLRGSIIKATSDNREFGKFEVVMINRGSDHQVMTGDVMAIKRASPAVVETRDGPVYTIESSRMHKILSAEGDYKMPEEKLGEVIVFKVYQQASMALILNTQKPARLQDLITSPE